jgi:hypothetical protein
MNPDRAGGAILDSRSRVDSPDRQRQRGPAHDPTCPFAPDTLDPLRQKWRQRLLTAREGASVPRAALVIGPATRPRHKPAFPILCVPTPLGETVLTRAQDEIAAWRPIVISEYQA